MARKFGYKNKPLSEEDKYCRNCKRLLRPERVINRVHFCCNVCRFEFYIHKKEYPQTKIWNVVKAALEWKNIDIVNLCNQYMIAMKKQKDYEKETASDIRREMRRKKNIFLPTNIFGDNYPKKEE